MKGSTAEIPILEMKPFEALQEWNRTLLEKIGEQTDLIKRMSRLKRYLSPQLAMPFSTATTLTFLPATGERSRPFS